jgi:hypothetical protein
MNRIEPGICDAGHRNEWNLHPLMIKRLVTKRRPTVGDDRNRQMFHAFSARYWLQVLTPPGLYGFGGFFYLSGVQRAANRFGWRGL